MKKKLISVLAILGIVITLLIVFGGHKDILKNMLDTGSIDLLNFTEDELNEVLKKSNVTLEDKYYKCSFLDYDAILRVKKEQIVYREDLSKKHYAIDDITIYIPVSTEEERAAIEEKVKNYVTSDLGLDFVEDSQLTGYNYRGEYNKYKLEVNVGDTTPGPAIILSIDEISK